MRVVKLSEQRKRGCQYCADRVGGKRVGGKYIPAGCPHDECPYHELDSVDSFEDYLKQNGGGSVSDLLKILGRS